MEDFWSTISGEFVCSETIGKHFCYDFKFLKDSSACIFHLMIICFDVLLLIMMMSFVMIQKSSLRPFRGLFGVERYSNLQLASAILNGSVGLLHLCLGIWNLEKLRKTNEGFPLSWWLPEFSQGFTWLLVGLTASLRLNHLPRACLWLFSILIFFFSSFLCALSMFYTINSRELSLKDALDFLSFPGAIFLLLCTYKISKYEDNDRENDESHYAPLSGQLNEVDPISHVTPFAKAGFLSKISFWRLSPLMKEAQKKTLQDEDIPKLPESDRAESCYSSFVEQLRILKEKEPLSQKSYLWAIIFCHRREILMSGLFALLKVLTLSASPLLLNAFILVSEGDGSFKYEGYALAILFLLTKIIESVSQRQWYFRSRIYGMRVRSQLTAAIYKKQLRLSNDARLIHSGGEIMNYVNVDAYRIGEFPFWFHQTWTLILQLCIVLLVLFYAVGLATIASLVVIVVTVLCNVNNLVFLPFFFLFISLNNT